MNCRDAKELVHAYVDDELDIVTARQLDQHLAECGQCKAAVEGARAVQSAVADPRQYYKAPADLLQRVRQSLITTHAAPVPLRESKTYRSPRVWWGLALAAAIVLASGLFLMVNRQAENPVIAEVLTAHLRSLQPGHLMDVVSTNQHTVKPWFDTHVDFSPPVRQLAPEFPLVGGRLDYLQNRPVAVLIYKHGDHLINLFVWPGDSGESHAAQRGFNFVHWSADGMTFWAVSDTSDEQLRHFAQLFQSSSSAPASQK